MGKKSVVCEKMAYWKKASFKGIMSKAIASGLVLAAVTGMSTPMLAANASERDLNGYVSVSNQAGVYAGVGGEVKTKIDEIYDSIKKICIDEENFQLDDSKYKRISTQIKELERMALASSGADMNEVRNVLIFAEEAVGLVHCAIGSNGHTVYHGSRVGINQAVETIAEVKKSLNINFELQFYSLDNVKQYSKGIFKIEKVDVEIKESKPTEQTGTAAAPTASKVYVDGKVVAFEAYNIAGNNYFKIRDVAQVMRGTKAQFEVVWDREKSAINIMSGKSYTTIGGELKNGDGRAKSATLTVSPIYLDGGQVKMMAYNINGNNFFKLRDIGKMLGFNVSFDNNLSAVVIDSTSEYTED